MLCFSVGLALTLVLVGVAAALGLRHAASRWPGFEALAARAPYLSGAIVAAVGAYTIAVGARRRLLGVIICRGETPISPPWR